MSFNNPYGVLKLKETNAITKKDRKHKKKGPKRSQILVEIEINDDGYIFNYTGNLLIISNRRTGKTVKKLIGITPAGSKYEESRSGSSITIITAGKSYTVEGFEEPGFNYPLSTIVEASDMPPNTRFVKGVLGDMRMGRSFLIFDKHIHSSSEKRWIYKLSGGEEVVGDDTPISTED